MTAPIFLTGATGFLGSSVLDQLLSRGHSVRCLVRRPVTLPDGAEAIEGDLGDVAGLTEAMKECVAVLHLAAMVKDWVPASQRGLYRDVNVTGLQNLMDAAVAADVGRFVYTSSFFALGPTDQCPDRTGDESLPLRDHGFHHPYEQTKSEARSLFQKRLAEGFPGIVLYPAVIYGPGPRTEGNHVAKLIADYLARKVPGIPGSGEQRWCFARVKDVAAGHLQALERGRTGEGYVLGGENCTLGEFFQRLHTLTNVRPPRLRIPIVVMTAVGAMEEALGAITGRVPQMTRGSARLYRYDWAYDSSKAKEEFSYSPASLDVGLKETLEWLKAET